MARLETVAKTTSGTKPEDQKKKVLAKAIYIGENQRAEDLFFLGGIQQMVIHLGNDKKQFTKSNTAAGKIKMVSGGSRKLRN